MISKIIRKMRIASGFSQKQLGEKIGVALSTISGYELGKNQPLFTTVLRIAKACDYDIVFIDKNSGETISIESRTQKNSK